MRHSPDRLDCCCLCVCVCGGGGLGREPEAADKEDTMVRDTHLTGSTAVVCVCVCVGGGGWGENQRLQTRKTQWYETLT